MIRIKTFFKSPAMQWEVSMALIGNPSARLANPGISP